MTAPEDPRGARHRRGFDRSEQVWELMRRAQRLFAVETDVPDDAYAFGFLTTLGYGAAWHMERLPERDAARGGPDANVRPLPGHRLVRPGRGGSPASERRLPGLPRRRLARGRRGGPRRGPTGRRRPGPSLGAAASRGSGHRPARHLPGLGRRCLEHISVGDIYQIQIGHRIEVRTPLPAARRLPAAAPEQPVAVHVPGAVGGPHPDRRQPGTVAPDRGRTRDDAADRRHRPPRAADPDEDARRRRRAASPSEKERAEHIMLVDLCRNDIGPGLPCRAPCAVDADDGGRARSRTCSTSSPRCGPTGRRCRRVVRAARHVPGGHHDRAPRRSAPWRSSRRSRARRAASTRARWA